MISSVPTVGNFPTAFRWQPRSQASLAGDEAISMVRAEYTQYTVHARTQGFLYGISQCELCSDPIPSCSSGSKIQITRPVPVEKLVESKTVCVISDTTSKYCTCTFWHGYYTK